MEPHGRSRFGLTLVDVLVVAVIVLILVYLLPLIRYQPRERTGLHCKSMLSHIGKAVFLYSEAHGGYIPWLEGRPATDSLALLYPDIIAMDLVFRCPATGDHPELAPLPASTGEAGLFTFGPKPAWSSYGYDARPVTMQAESRRPMAADMDGSSVADPKSTTANHRGGQNVLFYDTHVDWLGVNKWDNHGIPDNIFAADPMLGDSDTFIRR